MRICREGTRRGFAPHPTRGMIPLDPLLRKFLDVLRQLDPRCCFGKDSKTCGLVLLARPPLAANPDAKHPGKAEE